MSWPEIAATMEWVAWLNIATTILNAANLCAIIYIYRLNRRTLRLLQEAARLRAGGPPAA